MTAMTAPPLAIPTLPSPSRPISESGCHTTPGWTGEQLHPVRADHATAPIDEGFDWDRCLESVTGGPWYLVVFRSVRRPEADAEILTEFDDLAHLEARGVGGLRLYFKGEAGPDRSCLSLCLWDSPEQARAALRLPRHQAAVGIAHRMYERFTLERYVVARDPATHAIGFSRA